MGDVAGHSASGTSCSDVSRESLLSLTHVLSPPFLLPDPKFVQKIKSLFLDFAPNGSLLH